MNNENTIYNVDNYVDKIFLSFSFLRKFFLLQIIKILIKGAFKYIILIALYPIGVVARGEKR